VSRLAIPKIFENVHALTGSSLDTLPLHKSQKLTGVHSFDVHPTGFYLAISYSFNISIYAIQHNSMALLYSTSMEHLKKVMYSPEGSMLIMFSLKKIRILNPYSFEVQSEIEEKNHTIMDIYWLPKRNAFLTLYENGLVT
jgi:uncharacterized protein with WD repeat